MPGEPLRERGHSIWTVVTGVTIIAAKAMAPDVDYAIAQRFVDRRSKVLASHGEELCAVIESSVAHPASRQSPADTPAFVDDMNIVARACKISCRSEASEASTNDAHAVCSGFAVTHVRWLSQCDSLNEAM